MNQVKLVAKGVLGNSGFQASRIGLGCMGLSAFYGNPATEEDALNLIGKAIEQGVNFFDTAAIYMDNEELMAKAIKKFGRDKFFIATKVAPMKLSANGQLERVPQTKENIKNACDISLKRLQIEQIDLFYEHRVDSTIPIEEQAQAFKELVQEGKIKYYGLSEASVDTIRRAHKVHPITALQEEYSLHTRDVEANGVLDTCKELGIALVAYSPLGRGLLTGAITNPTDLTEKDWRHSCPRFKEENMKQNQAKIDKLNKIAKSLNVTTGQIALAWLLSRGDNVFPIPGTKKEKYLTENNQSSHVKLTPEQIKTIDELFPPGSVVGDRYNEFGMKACAADTPQLK